MEDLINFIGDVFNTENVLQGVIVAFFSTLMLRRYASIIKVTLIAAFFDMLLIPMGIEIMNRDDDADILGVATGTLTDITAEPQNLILRLAFLFISISIFYGMKSLFRRIG